jgi:cell division protein FtsW
MRPRRKADQVFLGIVIVLVVVGSFLFVSSWLGLLAREETKYTGVLFNHFLSVALGIVALVVASKIPYQLWKKYSFYIFVGSIILTALVFIPGIGVEHGGAHRWIYVGPISIQPAEFLKIGFIVYFAAFLSSLQNKLHSLKDGVLQIFIILAIVSVMLLKQPDTGTLIVIIVTAIAMFVAAGGRWRHVFGFFMTGVAGVLVLATVHPYIQERLLTFIDPARDALGTGWQIKQSLIAIGSGGLFGRGFGQSIQKFNYLPEPIGDSIFPVAAEEFGFVGSLVIVALFVALAVRGFQIARRAPNKFSGLLVIGIVILITVQSFWNIGSMLGVFPLTGIPLLFISHGGTAFILIMLAVGIVLNISKHIKS